MRQYLRTGMTPPVRVLSNETSSGKSPRVIASGVFSLSTSAMALRAQLPPQFDVLLNNNWRYDCQSISLSLISGPATLGGLVHFTYEERAMCGALFLLQGRLCEDR
jgi:hypothetical protein